MSIAIQAEPLKPKEAHLSVQCADYVVVDGDKQPLPAAVILSLYIIQDGVPDVKIFNPNRKRTGRWITNLSGELSVPISVWDPNNNEGKQLKVVCEITKMPTYSGRKLGSEYKNVLNTTIDNGRFISKNKIVYEVEPNMIWLKHTELKFNATISIEWDADQDYIDQVKSSIRKTSDFMYDYTDGQAKLDTVVINDNMSYYNGADIQIRAENNVSAFSSINGFLKNRYLRLPRFRAESFGFDADIQRNTSVSYPYVLNDSYHKTIGHEMGHYFLGLYDEYMVYDPAKNIFVFKSYHIYGLMENQNQTLSDQALPDEGVPGSEMSNKKVYEQNPAQTMQFNVNRMSCFEYFATSFTEGLITRCRILQPHQQDSSLLGENLFGPKMYFVGPKLTVGAPSSTMVVYSNNLGEVNPPTPKIVKMKFLNIATGMIEYAPGSVVIQNTANGNFILQGEASDTGEIRLLGAKEGDLVRCNYTPRAVTGTGYLTAEFTYSATLLSVIDVLLEPFFSPIVSSGRLVADETPLSRSTPFGSIQNFYLTKDGLGISIEGNTPNIQWENIKLDTVSRSFSNSEKSIFINSNSSEGMVLFTGKSDKEKKLFAYNNFLFYTGNEIEPQRFLKTQTGDIKIYLSDTSVSKQIEKLLLVTSDFPVPTQGLLPNQYCVSKVLDLSFYPDLSKVKSSLIFKLNKAIDLENTHLYRWNSSKWVLSGESVHTDTLRREMYYNVNQGGTYAIFKQGETEQTKIIKNDELGFDFNIHPNPARESISIVHSADKVAFLKIVLMDVLGKVVWETESKELGDIKLPKLSSGLYLLKLTDSKMNSSKTKTLVIN